MTTSMLPFNIDILTLEEKDVQAMRPVRVLDIFDGFSKNFHPDGLFSVSTFGKPGSEIRSNLYSYIDLKIPVFHPTLFKAICDLKELYLGIMAGREYAVYDPELKDFVKSTIVDGETGYAFFVKHFNKLVFEDRPSDQRHFLIALIQKYRKQALFTRLVVMPAGLRDYSVDANGKPSEDEINPLYRRVMAIAQSMGNVNLDLNPEFLNTGRFNLQMAVQAIYDYVISLLEGKRKLLQGRFAARKIENSTRNVITSYVPETTTLHGPKTVGPNHTVVGLYQYMRTVMPILVKSIKDEFSSKVFTGPNSPAYLVNKKTLKREMVHLSPEYYDEWMTYEGIEKTCARFKEKDLRHLVMESASHYFGLIYKGPDQTFRFMQDIDELPEGRSKDHVYPITMAEVLYLAAFRLAPLYPGFVTRYPITGLGSIYPSWIYLKSTVKGEVRRMLGDDWQDSGIEVAEFPIRDQPFYDSMSPGSTHLQRLGAD